jgi:hypothetical protein
LYYPMTIAEAREKSKSLLAKVPRDILIISIIVLASSASFGLGYLAGLEGGLSAQTGQGSGTTLQSSPLAPGTAGQVVASKGGTKYYFPSCTGANAISEGNKVWFISASAAEAAGYTPASNCKTSDLVE